MPKYRIESVIEYKASIVVEAPTPEKAQDHAWNADVEDWTPEGTALMQDPNAKAVLLSSDDTAKGERI